MRRGILAVVVLSIFLTGCTEKEIEKENVAADQQPILAVQDVYPIIEELTSPEGTYRAVASTTRTYVTVSVQEINGSGTWEFTLPDGNPIPEYTFLPEEWGEWKDHNTLRLTVGKGGDAGEQHVYRVLLFMNEGELTGQVLEETAEILPGTYDFDHDGEGDVVEVVALTGEDPERPVWHELRINDGQWIQEAHWAHMGWASIFALEKDGQEYLLRYSPAMGQGAAYYSYEIFSLNDTGEERLWEADAVAFDVNFGAPHHTEFDPVALANFLEKVHDYLDESTLLLSTEGFGLKINLDGSEFEEDFKFWDEYCHYDESKTLEENLRHYEEFCLERMMEE